MESKSAYTIVLSSRADKEISQSWEWYEERQKGLGEKFIIEVKHTIDKLQATPELYTAKYKSYREVIIRTFPLLVVYRINNKKKVIRIISVFHTSRNTKGKYL